jgi:putative transposase
VTRLDPTMVMVSRESGGRWYVTFATDGEAPEPLERTGHAVGVDLGITDFAVTSNGERIANPRHPQRKALNLARYQRRLARCRKGSANQVRATTKVARAHRKVRSARSDFLHRASTRLVRDNDVIVIEDLNVFRARSSQGAVLSFQVAVSSRSAAWRSRISGCGGPV